MNLKMENSFSSEYQKLSYLCITTKHFVSKDGQQQEDKVSAVKIVNARHTTDQSRHKDVKCFAIQDWKEAGYIQLLFIAGAVNPSNALTEPVG